MIRTIILSSASPARKALLSEVGFDVLVEPTHTEELFTSDDPETAALSIAQQKMDAYLRLHPHPAAPVITVDTLIGFQGRFIGKQESREEAAAILREFSGRTHSVHSGAVLYFPGSDTRFSASDRADITFHDLSEEEIEEYLDCGEWVGAAGAYRIQHRGISLVSSLSGDFYSVVGLPLIKIFGIVRGQSSRLVKSI